MAQLERKSHGVFDEFTQKYALSKTLRFELKPVFKTPELLENNAIIPSRKHL